MKLRMACVADGTVRLPGTVEFMIGRLEYTFVADSDRLLREIVLVSPIDHPERFTSSFVPREGPVRGDITIEMDEELINSLRERLQALESHLAFRVPLTRIRWDSARFSLVFETEAEREGHTILSFQLDRSSAELPIADVTVRDLGVAIGACDRFASLTTLLAFVREGNNEFHTFRFINAFYNFYFVLEGLYGRGHWRNREVAREFASNQAFQLATTRALELLRNERAKIYSQLIEFLKPASEQPTAAEVAEWLVAQRGALHHFANRGGSGEATPFTHLTFEPLCQLTRAIAIFAVNEEMVLTARREGTGPEKVPS